VDGNHLGFAEGPHPAAQAERVGFGYFDRPDAVSASAGSRQAVGPQTRFPPPQARQLRSEDHIAEALLYDERAQCPPGQVDGPDNGYRWLAFFDPRWLDGALEGEAW
jgi:hypothetical protein